MSVGAASIKRAANKAATEEAAKKTSSKKVTSATVPSVSPEIVEKMKLNQNQAVHLTEELPIHLL